MLNKFKSSRTIIQPRAEQEPNGSFPERANQSLKDHCSLPSLLAAGLDLPCISPPNEKEILVHPQNQVLDRYLSVTTRLSEATITVPVRRPW